MKQAIKVTKLRFSYGQNEVIHGINFQVAKGKIATLIGNTGGGKTSLVKLLIGLEEGQGQIELLGENLEALSTPLEQIIRVVFASSYQTFRAKNVKNILMHPLKNMNLKEEEINIYLGDIVALFKIEHLLSKNPKELTKEEASIIAIATALVTKPQILILDDAFIHMGAIAKKRIFRILKQLNRKNHLTIFNVTHDVNDILYGDYVILLYQGKVVLKGDVADVIKSEKILKKYHYELPFMAELSDKLRYYNVIEETILDMNRMVSTIWK